jgi:hypothetical protein
MRHRGSAGSAHPPRLPADHLAARNRTHIAPRLAITDAQRFSLPLPSDPRPDNPFFQLCVASILYFLGAGRRSRQA